MAAAERPTNVIGPNAVLQMRPALGAVGGADLVRSVFEMAGLSRHLETPPTRMVDEADVARLFAAVYGALSADAATAAARDAGRLTADYILANRIPGLAQTLLRQLPPRLAANALAWMIAKNSWTFAGSGRFTVRYGRTLTLAIADNPIAVGRADATGPSCHWHCAVFERLFRSLGAHHARVVETDCCADGAPACVFELDPVGR
jgi:divinyl protochlorophyllide a 8-vinyl-reductase